MSFRVHLENGDEYSLTTKTAYSLGIDGDQTCVEIRKGADSGKQYPRLVALKKCAAP